MGSEAVFVKATAQDGEAGVWVNGKRADLDLSKFQHEEVERLNIQVETPELDFLPLGPAIVSAVGGAIASYMGWKKEDIIPYMRELSVSSLRTLYGPYVYMSKDTVEPLDKPEIWAIYFPLNTPHVDPSISQKTSPFFWKRAEMADKWAQEIKESDLEDILRIATVDSLAFMAVLLSGWPPVFFPVQDIINRIVDEDRKIGFTLTPTAGFVLFHPSEMDFIKQYWPHSQDILKPKPGMSMLTV